MLSSIGKDSSVMLRLALKAFHPAPPPFPFLHVDTTWKFREMYALRDRMAAVGPRSHRARQGRARAGHRPVQPRLRSAHRRDEDQALKQALDAHGFDIAIGGALRDEERSRAKERVFSFRSAKHAWDPKNQRPELWRLYNARKRRGESVRAFPLSAERGAERVLAELERRRIVEA